jgi:protease-4
MPLFFRRKGSVAVVEIYGVIGAAVKVPTYARLFDSIAKSKKYRALLLDIDSPGGSATGSDLLYHSLKRVAETKPVVAYVRGMGASGGYYLCCAASQVVALPSALVGSVGVIYLRPILEQLLGRMGVEFSVFKGGRLKDMTGFWRSPTDEEQERFQGLVSEMYDTFVSVVAQGRSMDAARVEELATGEIYTARRGRELGLVDQLGDFNLALGLAAGLGDTRPLPRYLRPRVPLAQRLMGRHASRYSALEGLSADVGRMLGGGIYYLEPSLSWGEHWGGGG